MDPESEAMFMQNIKDYLFDEGKVLTCKFLSSTFSLHINSIRQLIEKFLCSDEIKKGPKTLKKTYFVSGILRNGNELVSSIIREEDLQSFKEKLNVVFSEHLYSIQNNGSLTDIALLYVANQNEEKCKGIIANHLALKRNGKDIASSRGIAFSKIENKSVPVAKVENKLFAVSSSKVEIKKEVDEGSKVNNLKTKEDENVKVDEKLKPVVSHNNKTNNNKKKGNIAGFFSKQVAGPKSDIKNIQSIKVEEKIVKKEDDKMEASFEHKQMKDLPNKNEKKENVSPVHKKENTLYNSSHNKSKSNKSEVNSQKQNKKDVGKKRKRIQTVDSDSEEEQTNVDIDDVFDASSPEPMEKPQLSDDEEDVIPPTPEVKNKSSINPRKRKKVVDKTFMDENGYIITKKEEIFESCSENEEEKDTKTKTIPAGNGDSAINGKSNKTASPVKGKKKTSPVAQVKQQSLMNFFKKTPK